MAQHAQIKSHRRWRTSPAWIVLGVVGLLLAARLPFLAPALDNTDSINFDLGVHDYDPGIFQPHPPGYPVYIALAKAAHGLVAGHAAALALISAIFGSLVVIPLFFLMRTLLRQSPAATSGAVVASAFTLLNPTLWFNGVRPMSDVPAFFFITSAQCLLLAGVGRQAAAGTDRPWLWLLGAACAGLAAGVRLQALWCVGPLFVYTLWRQRSWRLAGVGVFSVTVAAWLLPMVALSGGVVRFGRSFHLLLANALPGEPLFSRPTLNYAAERAADVLLTPWQDPLLAACMLTLAAIGALILAAANRRLLALWAVLFAPYAGYHYLLQETAAVRYAVPIVPAVAVLAAIALTSLPPRLALAVPLTAAWAAAAAAATTLPALSAYRSSASPSHQALEAVARVPPDDDAIVFGHHIYERYLHSGRTVDRLKSDAGARAALLTYWKEGGRRPVLFLADPRRLTLLFFGRDTQQSLGYWAWPDAVRGFMQGEQPGAVALVRLSPPRWMTESGLRVSPEAGPVEQVVQEPAVVHVRTSPQRRRTLVVSGVLRQQTSARARLKIGGRPYREWNVGEHFTLRTMIDSLPGSTPYLPLELETTSPVEFTDVWLEPEGQPLIRPTRGFSSPERDEQGRQFRWIGPEATAVAYVPAPRGRLTIEGWLPESYYDLPLTLHLAWNGKPLPPAELREPWFVLEREVQGTDAEGWGELTLRPSHAFVPHERQRNGDHRTLSVRIYGLNISSQ